jgi:nucleoside-diphosphate-sugar epimerase
MRILLTGSAGCLGHYVAADLAARGFDVVGIYRNRRPQLQATAHFEPVRCNLADGDDLPGSYDAVFHTAASSPGPDISAADLARDNVESTRRLVAHARTAGARHFIFCSSLSVYGDIAGSDVDETTPVHNPGSYGLSKLLGEAMVAELAPDISALSLRLPAVVGPGAGRNFLATTVARLKANEAVDIFNPDAAFNNAVHCADIAALVVSALARSWREHEALVVGAAGATTVKAAVERLRARLGSSSVIVAKRAPKAAFLLRSGRAIERYGYAPMAIEAMLDRYADDVQRKGA